MWNVFCGLVLMVLGLAVAYRLAPSDARPPSAGWFPDPASRSPVVRFWDGAAWTRRTRPGIAASLRGHRFRGLGGPWAVWALGAVVVFTAGSVAYLSTASLLVMQGTSFLAQVLAAWSFFLLIDYRLALREVVRTPAVIAMIVAGYGLTEAVPGAINHWVAGTFGTTAVLGAVGVVEEGLKFALPLVLLLVGRYRNPRAGIALGLASGIGFAISETTGYVRVLAAASGPSICGGDMAASSAGEIVRSQAMRLIMTAPQHWCLCGLAVAVAWRAWWLSGRRGTVPAVGALFAVMVVHSLSDLSVLTLCGNAPLLLELFVVSTTLVMPVLLYLGFRAAARRSTPPARVVTVVRSWRPRRLGAAPETVRSGGYGGSHEPPAR